MDAGGRRASSLEVLLEHHFEQEKPSIGITSDALVKLVKLLAISPVDLSNDDPGVIVLVEFLVTFLVEFLRVLSSADATTALERVGRGFFLR